jgi:hypothetical protein
VGTGGFKKKSEKSVLYMGFRVERLGSIKKKKSLAFRVERLSIWKPKKKNLKVSVLYMGFSV